jgi:hypothetical protein
MSPEHRRSRWFFVGIVLLAVLGHASRVLAQAPPPFWKPSAFAAPAAGGALAIAGLLGYGIYRLRKRK